MVAEPIRTVRGSKQPMHEGDPHWFDFLTLGLTAFLSAMLVYLTGRQWSQARPHVYVRGYGPKEGGLEVAYIENRGGAGTTVLMLYARYYRQREPRSLRLFKIYRWPIWRQFSRLVAAENRPVTRTDVQGFQPSEIFIPAHSTLKVLFEPLTPPEDEPALWVALSPFVVHGKAHTTWNRRRHGVGVSLTVSS